VSVSSMVELYEPEIFGFGPHVPTTLLNKGSL